MGSTASPPRKEEAMYDIIGSMFILVCIIVVAATIDKLIPKKHSK
jgi:hypothetical protein